MQRRSEAAYVAAALFAGLAVTPHLSQAQAEASMAATVGEIVRLEAQRVLDGAKRSVAPPAATLSIPRAPEAPQGNTDVVELLGISQRERSFAADVAINGLVTHVKQGDRVGQYSIKAIGGACIYIIDPGQGELIRCVAPTRKGV